VTLCHSELAVGSRLDFNESAELLKLTGSKKKEGSYQNSTRSSLRFQGLPLSKDLFRWYLATLSKVPQTGLSKAIDTVFLR
jgi:hypothetical protein